MVPLDIRYQRYQPVCMPQLLVRNLEESLVRTLKARAAARGVPMEEEHRQILRDAVRGARPRRPSLADFLLDPANAAAAEVEIPLRRRRTPENRDTGL